MSLTLLTAGLVRAVFAVVSAVAAQLFGHTVSIPAGKLSRFASHYCRQREKGTSS